MILAQIRTTIMNTSTCAVMSTSTNDASKKRRKQDRSVCRPKLKSMMLGRHALVFSVGVAALAQAATTAAFASNRHQHGHGQYRWRLSNTDPYSNIHRHTDSHLPPSPTCVNTPTRNEWSRLLASNADPSQSAPSDAKKDAKKGTNVNAKTDALAPSAPSNANAKAWHLMSVIRSHFDQIRDDDAHSLVRERLQNKGATRNPPFPREWLEALTYLYLVADRLPTQQVQDVLDFVSSVCPPHVAQKVIQTEPRILRKDVAVVLKPIYDFLTNLWGDKMLQQAMEHNPGLLLAYVVMHDGTVVYEEMQYYWEEVYGQSSHPANSTQMEGDIATSVSTQMEGDIATPVSTQMEGDIATSVSAQMEGDIATSVSTHVKFDADVTYLRSVLDEEVLRQQRKSTNEVINTILKTALQNAWMNTEGNLQQRVEYLVDTLQLSRAETTKLLLRRGSNILNLSMEDDLQPKFDLLFTMLTPQQLKKSLIQHPRFLRLSLCNLETKIAYFDAIENNAYGQDRPASLAALVLRKAIAVYTKNLTDNIQPTVEFLCSTWDQPTAISMLRTSPDLLKLSLERNLRPKVEFLHRMGYMTRGRISGRDLAASLHKRMLPRWHYAQSQGNIQPKLSALATATDAKFCAWHGFDLKHFENYKKEELQHLKFEFQSNAWVKTGQPIDDDE